MRLSGFDELINLDATFRGAGYTCSPLIIRDIKRELKNNKTSISRLYCEVQLELDFDGFEFPVIRLYWPQSRDLFYQIIYRSYLYAYEEETKEKV